MVLFSSESSGANIRNKSHNGDGRHLAYLDRPEFSNLEPRLHSALTKIVRCGQRSLEALERANILPFGTAFFRDPTVDIPAAAIVLGPISLQRRLA